MQLTAYEKTRDIALDENGDWLIAGGDVQLIGDGPAILQACQIALEFFQGEWFLDTSAGVPWWQQVLVKNPAPGQLAGVFRNALLGVAGVKQVLSLELSYDPPLRSLSVEFEVQTDLGLLPGSVVLGARGAH